MANLLTGAYVGSGYTPPKKDPWQPFVNLAKWATNVKQGVANYAGSLTQDQYEQQRVDNTSYDQMRAEVDAYNRQMEDFNRAMDEYNRNVAQQQADYTRQMNEYYTRAAEAEAERQQQINDENERAQMRYMQALQQTQMGNYQTPQLAQPAEQQAGYLRSAIGGVESYTTPGNVIATQPYQFDRPDTWMGVGFGANPAPSYVQGRTERPRESEIFNAFRPETRAASSTNPSNYTRSSAPYIDSSAITRLGGTPLTQNVLPETITDPYRYGNKAEWNAYREAEGRIRDADIIARLNWQKSGGDPEKFPGVPLDEQQKIWQQVAAEKNVKINNPMVWVNDKNGNPQAIFAEGKFKGLPALYFENAEQFIANKILKGEWSPDVGWEYARLLGITKLPYLTSEKTQTLPITQARAGYTTPGYSGYGGYGGSGGYYTPRYSGGSTDTTPATSYMPGWLRAWQKVRI